jgi:hypothetical protein
MAVSLCIDRKSAMKKTIQMMCVAVVVTLGAATSAGDISPVPITLDYAAYAHANADSAAAGIMVQHSSTGDQTDYTLNGPAEAHAHSDAMGEYEILEIDPDTGEEWWLPVLMGHITVHASAMATGSEHPFGATLSSLVEMEIYGNGDAGGEATADTSLDATVGIGNSPQFPLGAGGLTLHLEATISGSLASPWSVSIISLDPDNPIDVTLNDAALLANLPVLAGQELSVSLVDSLDIGVDVIGDTIETRRREIQIEFAVTPEPATLTLLALGGLAIVRRRKLTACK